MATVVTLWAAATTAVGPTVVELSPTHGVHLGDIIVGVAAVGSAALLVFLVATASAR